MALALTQEQLNVIPYHITVNPMALTQEQFNDILYHITINAMLLTIALLPTDCVCLYYSD